MIEPRRIETVRIDPDLEAAVMVAIETGEAQAYDEMIGVPALRPYDWSLRDWFVRQFGFAVPCREAVNAIAAHGPVLEVGAGTGMWSAILSHHTSVVATDLAASNNPYGQAIGAWHPVEEATAAAAVAANPGRTVLMVWPSYAEPWAHEAAKAMSPGTVLCYIGEGDGGCTADDALHKCLWEQFDEVAEISIPQFYGLNDYLSIRRKCDG